MLKKFINIYYNAQIKLKFINIYYNEQIKLTSRIIRLWTPRPKDHGHSRPSNLYSQKKREKRKKACGIEPNGRRSPNTDITALNL